MRKLAVALAVLASLTSSAFAAEGPLMVRLRGVYIVPADKNDALPGAPATKDEISVSKKLIPEVDFTYFFLLPNLSAELILTYPQEHDVKLAGDKIGTVTHLPPCLTAQWHFLPGGIVNPYVGAGLNLTLITDQTLLDDAVELEKSSVGFVAQAGADFKVAEKIFVNVDVKYAQIGFDLKAKANGQKLTTVDLNPWLIGAGVGYRF